MILNNQTTWVLQATTKKTVEGAGVELNLKIKLKININNQLNWL